MADMEGRGREDKKSQNCSLSILTIAEQALINNLAGDFRSRPLTKRHALNFHSGKTVDRSILRVETRDSRNSFN
ncbi:MAG: hypothetical protein AUI95_01390 [Crenarchaeota archaeon 13_1_40CM_3_52_4]|nr:MAG: hypothetical protein AUI95_01390 [Crenarchaeota archaeon 13_1_40CM_3_52_4]